MKLTRLQNIKFTKQYSVLTYKLLHTFKQLRHILQCHQITAFFKQLSKKMVQLIPHKVHQGDIGSKHITVQLTPPRI